MNEPMNEEGLAKKFIAHLNQGADGLDNQVQKRLQAARQRALETYVQPSHNFVLAGNHGANHSRSHSPFRTWVSLAVLILGLLTVTYWQTSQDMDDGSEIDAPLLAHDLPLDAFSDTGFDTWLEGSSPE